MLQDTSDADVRKRSLSHDRVEAEYAMPQSPPSADDARLLDTFEPPLKLEIAPPLKRLHDTKPSAPAAPAAAKILFLDGLRGLAAMMVIVQHVGYMGIPMGQPAVDTFFVLSAFLLTMIFEKKARTLLAQKASYTRWGWALLDYFSRRFLRVYPLFAAVAIYLSLYSPQQKEKLFFVHHPEEYSVFKVLVFNFQERYHVFWTLPLEITYYFIIPVLVILLLKLQRFWIVPMLPLCYLVMYSGLYWFRLDHMPLKPHLPTFLCGSMAAIVYAKTDQWIKARGFEFRWYHRVVVRTIELVAIAVLFSTLHNGLFFDWIMKNPIPQTPGGHFISVNVSIVIVCEMLLPGAISSVLEWSLLRYAGKISFSMYLLHSFVIYSDWVRSQSYWNKFYAIWVLTFLLSTVSYQLIEYPCQLLAARVGKMIKAKDTEQLQREKTGQHERMYSALPVVA